MYIVSYVRGKGEKKEKKKTSPLLTNNEACLSSRTKTKTTGSLGGGTFFPKKTF